MTRPTARLCFLAVTLVLALSTAVAQAQPSETFTALQRDLKRGQTVVVEDVTGRRVKGEVAGLSDTTLTLDVSRKDHPSGRLEFIDTRVYEVVRRDSLLNGTLIGLGAGIASAVGFVRYNCGPPGYDQECALIASVVAVGFVPAGAALGALTDFLITRTLYRRSAPPALTFAPIVDAGRRGMRLTLRF